MNKEQTREFMDKVENWVSQLTVEYEDGRIAMRPGLIITLFFRNGHQPDVRKKLVDCVDKFYQEFGNKLKKHMVKRWEGITQNNYAKYRQEVLDSSEEESLSWYLSGAIESYLAPEYAISFIVNRVFHNEIDRSTIKLELPWNFLQQKNGIDRFQRWLLWLVDYLEAESGYAGLSFILPFEEEKQFPNEYQFAKRFSGLMVDSIGILEGRHVVNGIKGAAWYTVIGQPWLEKLGGEQTVRQACSDTPEITLLPYKHGVIIKAGEFPTLGEMTTEGLPPLLVKVNHVIRPIRLTKERSLHFYSDYVDFQFDKASTAKWLTRFDQAGEERYGSLDPKTEPVRITLWTGEPAPHTGMWATLNKRGLEYVTVKKGESLPPWFDNEQQSHRTQWTLLERDDGGPVEFDKVVKE